MTTVQSHLRELTSLKAKQQGRGQEGEWVYDLESRRKLHTRKREGSLR